MRPISWALQREGLLALWEVGSSRLSWPLLAAVSPRPKEPKGVITLPGFTGSEMSLRGLNRYLETLGYEARSWELGRNRGYSSPAHLNDIIRRITRQADSLFRATGAPVALIGHSLGGVYACEAASLRPDIIDRVITLGSPLSFSGPDARRSPPPRTALMSVYTPIDPLVPVEKATIPESLLDEAGTPRENIMIPGSHLGLASNSLVWLTIADRLKTGLSPFEPYDPYRYLRAGWSRAWPERAAS